MIAPKGRRCHAHRSNLTLAPIKHFCTIPGVKFYVFDAFIYRFIGLLVVLNNVICAVGGVKFRVPQFSQGYYSCQQDVPSATLVIRAWMVKEDLMEMVYNNLFFLYLLLPNLLYYLSWFQTVQWNWNHVSLAFKTTFWSV